MASEAETAAMRRAVTLAARGLGATSPNPVVGCVVLDATGNLVGEGYHEFPGGSHAEIHALRAAGERARQGTLVVSLEPCDHVGRTTPCTAAILDAGVRRVVIGTPDPNPEAAGGANRLRAAGVDVETGVGAAETERVNEAWLNAVRLHRPFVTWKYAASLDGRVAAADGSSRWITGPEARADAHRLRVRSDAVLVGSGTVRADDPHLTARPPRAPSRPARQPLRVVVDTEARIPVRANVLDSAAPTLVAVAADVPADHLEGRACVVRLPRAPGGLDLAALLEDLHTREVVSILTEGGPTVAGALLAAGCLDVVVGYVAPALIGGGGLPALAGSGATRIEAAHRLRLDDASQVGDDLRLTARRREI